MIVTKQEVKDVASPMGWLVYKLMRKFAGRTSFSVAIMFFSSEEAPVLGEQDGHDVLGKLKSPPIRLLGPEWTEHLKIGIIQL